MTASDFSLAVSSLPEVTEGVIRHNRPDYGKFGDAIRRYDSLYESVEKKQQFRLRKKGLRFWDDVVSERFPNDSDKPVTLSSIRSDASASVKKLVDNRKVPYLWIAGGNEKEKMLLAYAAVRRMVGKGVVSPSGVKTLSEEQIISLGRSGFDGNKRLEEILSSRMSALILEGLGSKNGLHGTMEKPSVERVIEHIYSNPVPVVVTSVSTPKEMDRSLNSPAGSKILGMFGDSVVFLDDFCEDSPRKRRSVYDGSPTQPPRASDNFSEW